MPSDTKTSPQIEIIVSGSVPFANKVDTFSGTSLFIRRSPGETGTCLAFLEFFRYLTGDGRISTFNTSRRADAPLLSCTI